ncbi:MAG TPA: hypothetical protein VME21_12115 [Steroidobacteraceae bacterium]|nr:hypothetical protein [Steroidobacteraceae bacterium]
MRSLVLGALMLVTALAIAAVTAAEGPSVDDTLRSVAAMSAQKCPDLKVELAKAKQTEKPEVFSDLEATYHSVCVCMPAQVQTFRASLAANELAAPFSQSELQHRYTTEVIGQCAVEQLRATYGSGCPKRFASHLPDSGKYCRCVSEKLSRLPGAAAAALGLAYSDYMPAAAEARQKGQPAPEPAPILKKFLADERACRVP